MTVESLIGHAQTDVPMPVNNKLSTSINLGAEESEEDNVEALLEKITEVQGHLSQLLHRLDKVKRQGLKNR